MKNLTGKHARWAVIAGIAVVAVLVGLRLASPALSRMAREHIITALKEDYASEVEVGHLDVHLFPHVRMEGEDLAFHYQGRTDLPPLISIRKFTAETGLARLLWRPAHIRLVRIEGLQIHVPPASERSGDTGKSHGKIAGFLIEELIADGTKITIAPKDSGKEPLVWDVSRLTLWDAGPNSAASFRATLTNAKPPGEIESSGKFGPWQKDEPGDTPVSGAYTFQNADLSVFPGIAGKLSSEGNYRGVLERIEADGHTDTPDFRLVLSGNPVDLKTEFHAIVDGTDGDTLLPQVDAQFGHSSLVAKGGVTGTKGVKGKTVSLDVTASQARLEDMLRLGVKGSSPAMTGVVSFHTKLIVPPGKVDVAQKLKLDGSFEAASAHFEQVNIQEKVNEISNRGRGKPEAPDTDTVASDFSGSFVLNNGTMTFRNLAFRVPGIGVSLDGKYGLINEQLDFHGTVRLEAKLSETTTGFKSFLLKAADPFFKRKNAGAVVPVKIGGTQEKPDFGLDIGRGH